LKYLTTYFLSFDGISFFNVGHSLPPLHLSLRISFFYEGFPLPPASKHIICCEFLKSQGTSWIFQGFIFILPKSLEKIHMIFVLP
ncbi:hypothetical protein ACFV0Y_37490, partial [Streptomyces sp. NPDC059569]|uniref:hypothetical protein n=1 Tax=Streptomyces sp. NPDC059569 TaxID=3346869 RepID=UPI003686B60E